MLHIYTYICNKAQSYVRHPPSLHTRILQRLTVQMELTKDLTENFLPK